MRGARRAAALAAVLALAALAASPPATAARDVLRVCHHGCPYRSLQAAVDAAGRGDEIRIAPGTYRGGAVVPGSKDGLRIGGARGAGRTVLDGRHGASDSGVLAIDVDRLEVRNLTVRNFRSNGVFALGRRRPCRDYVMDRIVARRNGDYGLYAFNCRGGRMTRSTATLSGDGGFYIGATPPQSRPRRTLVSKVRSSRNSIGLSGTNMRYVEVVDSDFYDNGIGIHLGSFASEPYAPNGHNLILSNRVFWNNADIYGTGAARPPAQPAPFFGALASDGLYFPSNGTGIVLFGGARNVVWDNDVFGNFLHGVAIVQNALVDPPVQLPGHATVMPARNRIQSNRLGRAGRDPNGVADFFFATRDGTYGNCWSGNASATTDPPAQVLAPCPLDLPQPGGGEPWARAVALTTNPPSRFWSRHAHPRFGRFRPLPTDPR